MVWVAPDTLRQVPHRPCGPPPPASTHGSGEKLPGTGGDMLSVPFRFPERMCRYFRRRWCINTCNGNRRIGNECGVVQSAARRVPMACAAPHPTAPMYGKGDTQSLDQNL